ncbi:hypothetical protein GCM10009647_090010 [Streptomyces sanglieri]
MSDATDDTRRATNKAGVKSEESTVSEPIRGKSGRKSYAGPLLTDDGLDLTDSIVDLCEIRGMENRPVVVETESRLVVREPHGYGITEWANAFEDVSYNEFVSIMHDLADEHVNAHKKFNASWPLVFKK